MIRLPAYYPTLSSLYGVSINDFNFFFPFHAEMDVSQMLLGLGIATAFYVALEFLRFIYLHTRPSSVKRYLYGDCPWALVTGASDGIGLGIAQELATCGFNVILHGRDAEKLGKTKTKLQMEHKDIKFKVAVLNAATSTPQQIDDLAASFQTLNLTVLINNLGGGAKIQPLENNTADHIDYTLNVNARFPAQLTRALLRKLTRTDGPTLIMNIGSLGATAVPYATVYGGSKAFNMAMSSSLAIEAKVEGKDIEVLAILVGAVTDCTHTRASASFFTPAARTMAKACVDRVGCGRPVVVGYKGHAVQKLLVDLLPSFVLEMLVVPNMKARKEKEARKQEEERKLI